MPCVVFDESSSSLSVCVCVCVSVCVLAKPPPRRPLFKLLLIFLLRVDCVYVLCMVCVVLRMYVCLGVAMHVCEKITQAPSGGREYVLLMGEYKDERQIYFNLDGYTCIEGRRRREESECSRRIQVKLGTVRSSRGLCVEGNVSEGGSFFPFAFLSHFLHIRYGFLVD